MSSFRDDAVNTGDPTRGPVETETCANCGRAFTGDYCPSCGQRASDELSVVSILGGFARELLDTERGLWRTFRDLTLRPGTTVQRYLQGERRPFTSPGRYLLVGALIATGTDAALRGVGATAPGFGKVLWGFAAGFAEGGQNPGNESALGAVAQNFEEFGAVPALVLVLVTGLAGLLYRSLYRRETDSAAEALAVAAYGTAHGAILYQAFDFVFRLLLHYGEPVIGHPHVFHRIPLAVLFLYPGIVTYGCFGANWWNGIKGALGEAWAFIEAGLVVVVGMAGYAEWLVWAYPDGHSRGEPGSAIVAVTVVASLLLVHGAFELYARYRYGRRSA